MAAASVGLTSYGVDRAAALAAIADDCAGTEVELLPLDPGDWLDDADRQALHDALAESDADIAAGRLVDAAEVLQGLRSH